MVNLRRGGMQADQIAREMGCSTSTVTQHTTRFGSNFKRKKNHKGKFIVTNEKIKQMNLLYKRYKFAEDKILFKAIGKAVGLHHSTARRYTYLSDEKRENTRTNSELEQAHILMEAGNTKEQITKLTGWAKETLDHPGKELARKDQPANGD